MTRDPGAGRQVVVMAGGLGLAPLRLALDALTERSTESPSRLTVLLGRLGPVGDTAFVCGPELMMLSGARAFAAQHLAPSDIHVLLERNMHCGVAHCGRCQLGPLLLCLDGAVVSWDRVRDLLGVRGR